MAINLGVVITDYEGTQYVSSFPLGKKHIGQMDVREKTIGQNYLMLVQVVLS